MSGVLDPQTFPTIDVPAIWCPKKEKLRGNPLALAIEEQAKGSLLLSADPVEAVLRLLYGELEVTRAEEQPRGYNPEVQGDWDKEEVTFAFARRAKKISEERSEYSLQLEYELEGCGRYSVAVSADSVSIVKAD